MSKTNKNDDLPEGYHGLSLRLQMEANSYRSTSDAREFLARRLPILDQSVDGGVGALQRNMTDVLTPRGPDGFMLGEIGELTFPADAGQLYRGVRGVRIDPKTDRVVLDFDRAENRAEALFSARDVQDLASAFVTSATISLDPLSRGVGLEPLQECTIQPPCLTGSLVYTTMLHADLYLKWLISGHEMSARAPFAQRPMHAVLRERGLSPDMLYRLRSAPDRVRELAQGALEVDEQPPPQPVAARSWFECPEIDYRVEGDQSGSGAVSFIIDEADLRVRCSAFGPPRSATSDVDREPAVAATDEPSPEAPSDYHLENGLQEWDTSTPCAYYDSVRDLNDLQDVLCEVLPQLARLRELYRLVAAFRVAHVEATKFANSGSSVGRNLRAVAARAACVFHEADGSLSPRTGAVPHPSGTALSFRVVPTSFVLTGTALGTMPQRSDAEVGAWQPAVGDTVDALDLEMRWYTACILALSTVNGKRFALVSFEGWSAVWDTWLPLSRVAPCHTHTPERTADGQAGVLDPSFAAAGSTVEVQVGSLPSSSGALPVCIEGVVAETNADEGALVVEIPEAVTVLGTLIAAGTRLRTRLQGVRLLSGAGSPTEEDIAAGVAAGGIAPGHNIDALDEFSFWHKACVRDVDEERNMVLVHFHLYTADWDSWLPCNANFVAPFRHHTTYLPMRAGHPAVPAVGDPMFLRQADGSPKPGYEPGLVPCTVSSVIATEDVGNSIVRVREDSHSELEHEVTLGKMRLRMRSAFIMSAAPAPAILGQNGGEGLRALQSVDVRDAHYSWYTATIKGIQSVDGRVVLTISYDGWPSHYNECIALPSPRVQPLHTHTPEGFRSAQRALAPVVVPPVGTPVILKTEDTAPVETTVQSVTETEVVLELTDTGTVTRLPVPLAYGTITDPNAIGAAVQHEHGGMWAWLCGGIKLTPPVRQSASAQTPTRLDFATCSVPNRVAVLQHCSPHVAPTGRCSADAGSHLLHRVLDSGAPTQNLLNERCGVLSASDLAALHLDSTSADVPSTGGTYFTSRTAAKVVLPNDSSTHFYAAYKKSDPWNCSALVVKQGDGRVALVAREGNETRVVDVAEMFQPGRCSMVDENNDEWQVQRNGAVARGSEWQYTTPTVVADMMESMAQQLADQDPTSAGSAMLAQQLLRREMGLPVGEPLPALCEERESSAWSRLIEHMSRVGAWAVDRAEQLAPHLASVAADVHPFTGPVKSTQEFHTGHDLLTGEPVPKWLAAIGVVPLAGAPTKRAIKGVKRVWMWLGGAKAMVPVHEAQRALLAQLARTDVKTWTKAQKGAFAELVASVAAKLTASSKVMATKLAGNRGIDLAWFTEAGELAIVEAKFSSSGARQMNKLAAVVDKQLSSSPVLQALGGPHAKVGQSIKQGSPEWVVHCLERGKAAGGKVAEDAVRMEEFILNGGKVKFQTAVVSPTKTPAGGVLKLKVEWTASP